MVRGHSVVSPPLDQSGSSVLFRRSLSAMPALGPSDSTATPLTTSTHALLIDDLNAAAVVASPAVSIEAAAMSTSVASGTMDSAPISAGGITEAASNTAIGAAVDNPRSPRSSMAVSDSTSPPTLIVTPPVSKDNSQAFLSSLPRSNVFSRGDSDITIASEDRPQSLASLLAISTLERQGSGQTSADMSPSDTAPIGERLQPIQTVIGGGGVQGSPLLRRRPLNTVTPPLRASPVVVGAIQLELPAVQWGVEEVVEWLHLCGLDSTFKHIHKKKTDGMQLLGMNSNEIDRFCHGLDPQLKTAIAALQVVHGPLPLSAHWSVSEVTDWLEKRGLDASTRKSFVKKKIDGRELLKMRPETLEALGLVYNFISADIVWLPFGLLRGLGFHCITMTKFNTHLSMNNKSEPMYMQHYI